MNPFLLAFVLSVCVFYLKKIIERETNIVENPNDISKSLFDVSFVIFLFFFLHSHSHFAWVFVCIAYLLSEKCKRFHYLPLSSWHDDDLSSYLPTLVSVIVGRQFDYSSNTINLIGNARLLCSDLLWIYRKQTDFVQQFKEFVVFSCCFCYKIFTGWLWKMKKTAGIWIWR